MRVCGGCSTELDDGAKFCPECGTAKTAHRLDERLDAELTQRLARL